MADDLARRRLGRGLAALIGDAGGGEAAAIGPAARRAGCRWRCCAPNPRNPRKNFDDGDLDDLAASIRERGVVQADPGPAGGRAAATATRSSPASGAGGRRRGPGCTRCRSSSTT